MMYWKIFLAFFIPGIIGYGGGPSSIPLIQHEVVNHYQFVSLEGFAQILALGNALPGPIATKLAGYIGYEVGGVFGAVVALFATVAPSLVAMIMLLGLLYKYKESPKVKRMTALIRPTIAVLLLVIAYQFVELSWLQVGWIQTIVLVGVSWLALEKWKVHPAWMIAVSLLYGAVFL